MRLIVNKCMGSEFIYSLQASIALRIEIAYGLKENTDYKRLHLLNSELAHCSH